MSALLQRMREGDEQAEKLLYLRVHEALRSIARRELHGRRGQDSLNTTALIHEAYLRVNGREWSDRTHFLCFAARAMRSIVIDHARRARCAKRTPPGERLELDEIVHAYEERAGDLEKLDDALLRLAEVDPRAVELIELRFFAGLPMEECAEQLGLSVRTAQREWATARAWLREEVR